MDAIQLARTHKLEVAVRGDADAYAGYGPPTRAILPAPYEGGDGLLPRVPDGRSWVAEKIFTKRIPYTVEFQIDGPEFDLYRDITRFVKQQSTKAASQGDDPRARAVGFLMSLYQRRLASST
ncbi:MAG TPA: hypothetical protein VNO43_12285 [Candidatus Eisenbacteria bacterium]|nr:hypothetical protein [Candidatus Eisenbacteria bacterium]